MVSFNIGAEGQLYVAAFATAWVGITFANLPAVLLVPMCCAAAILMGAVWAAIPGVLKAKFGSHEVINTIMLNFIAIALVSYFTQYHYKAPGDPILQSVPIGYGAHIARLGKFIPGLPERIPLNLAFLLALFSCLLVYVFLWRTKWGYEIRSTGSNPSAAEYGGISIKKQIILAMAVSGALAGMVGINDVMGYRYRYYDGFSDNYGFTGIAVTLLGRNHPVGVIGRVVVCSPSTWRHLRRWVFRACHQRHCSSLAGNHHPVCGSGRLFQICLGSPPFKAIRKGVDDERHSYSWLAVVDDTNCNPLILAAMGGLFSER